MIELDIIQEDEATHRHSTKKKRRGRPPGRSFKQRMASRHLIPKNRKIRIWLDTAQPQE